MRAQSDGRECQGLIADHPFAMRVYAAAANTEIIDLSCAIHSAASIRKPVEATSPEWADTGFPLRDNETSSMRPPVVIGATMAVRR